MGCEKCAEQQRIWEAKCKEVSVRRSNCTNDIVWGMRSAERRKVNVLEVKCLRSLVGVSRINRVRTGIEREFVIRVDQRALRQLGHMKKMDEYHMARRVLMGKWRVGMGQRKVRLYELSEGNLGQQRDDGGGGCTTMHKRQEGVDSPGEYVDCYHCYFVSVFFWMAFPHSGGLSP